MELQYGVYNPYTYVYVLRTVCMYRVDGSFNSRPREMAMCGWMCRALRRSASALDRPRHGLLLGFGANYRDGKPIARRLKFNLRAH